MTDSCCNPEPPHLPEAAPETTSLSSGLTRRRLLVGGAVATGAVALTAVPSGGATASSSDGGSGATPIAHPETTDPELPTSRAFLPARPASERHVRPMMFPVAGRVTWTDTYLFPRGGGRRHEGQDLMGAKMLPLLATVDGTVAELRHRASGNSLYLKGDDGWYYCYLHINNDTPGTDDGKNLWEHAFAPGLANGSRVRKGDVIAYLGDSGNAETTGAHLHFEIRMPNANWYNAAAVNAKYSLDAAETANPNAAVPPETFVPWTNSADLLTRQYRDFFGRTAAANAFASWASKLDSGEISPEGLMQTFLETDECDDKTHAVARLYQAFFLRRPDFDGFWYWADRRRKGLAITSIADAFARSPEFIERYGRLSNAQFVDRIYQNVLGRAPDEEGRRFWTEKLDGGRSRGTVMVQFSDSPENRNKQRWRMHVIAVYGCMLRKMPTEDEITLWSALLSSGQNTTKDMCNLTRRSQEYALIVAGTT